MSRDCVVVEAAAEHRHTHTHTHTHPWHPPEAKGFVDRAGYGQGNIVVPVRPRDELPVTPNPNCCWPVLFLNTSPFVHYSGIGMYHHCLLRLFVATAACCLVTIEDDVHFSNGGGPWPWGTVCALTMCDRNKITIGAPYSIDSQSPASDQKLRRHSAARPMPLGRSAPWPMPLGHSAAWPMPLGCSADATRPLG